MSEQRLETGDAIRQLEQSMYRNNMQLVLAVIGFGIAIVAAVLLK